MTDKLKQIAAFTARISAATTGEQRRAAYADAWCAGHSYEALRDAIEAQERGQ